MTQKLCRSCGEERPLEDFYLRRRGSHYRQAYCRQCMNAYQREHRMQEGGRS